MDTQDEPPLPGRQPAEELLPAVYAELRRLAGALSGRLPWARPLRRPPWFTRPTCAWSATRAPVGRAGAISSGRRRRPCARSSSATARRKASHKRGGKSRRIELAEGLAMIEPPADDLLAVDEAIQRLKEERPDLAEIAVLRYYSGLSTEETAGALRVSVSTLKREWRFARAWLQRHLDEPGAHE